MDKTLRILSIDPEYRDLLPPLMDEERALLEEGILAQGCEVPLVVWNDTIVDGHNRYEICRKHGVPFAVIEKSFESHDEVLLWIIINQLSRRNMYDYPKALLMAKYEPLLKAQAKSRQIRKTADADSVVEHSAQQTKARTPSTRDRLAAMAGLSHDTLSKAKKLDESASDELKGQLMRDEISIHKAYTEVMVEEHAGETQVCERCGEEKPVSEFPIKSKRKGFSPFCKTCESEIAKEMRKAADQMRKGKPANPISPDEATSTTAFIPSPQDPPKHPRGIFTPERRVPPEWEKRRLSTDPIEDAFQLVYECLYPPVHQFLLDVKEVYERYHPEIRTHERTKLLRDVLCTTVHTVDEFDAFIKATQADSVNKNNQEEITHE